MHFFDRQIQDFYRVIGAAAAGRSQSHRHMSMRKDEGKSRDSSQTSQRLSSPIDALWEDAGRNEIVMQKEAAFEAKGVGFELFTSEKIGDDEVAVIGREIREIRKDGRFARVSLIELEEIEDEQTAHDVIRKVEFIKYHYFPKGYMIRTNSMSCAENVRISKKAIKAGISFQAVGNLLLSKYREDPHVKAAKIFFITDDTVDYDALEQIAEKTNLITGALDHVYRDMNTDCGSCHLKVICDEVEGMRELHFRHKIQ